MQTEKAIEEVWDDNITKPTEPAVPANSICRYLDRDLKESLRRTKERAMER
jgi:hypothetical protein